MAKAFKSGIKGINGYLEPAERELLRSLFDDVVSMLEPEERANQDPLSARVGRDTEARAPSDRPLSRLPPNAPKQHQPPTSEARAYPRRARRHMRTRP